MSSIYRAFGLTIHSSRQIPWLPAHKHGSDVDIWIDLEGDRNHSEPARDEKLICLRPVSDDTQEPLLSVWKRATDGRYRFRYGDGTEFTIDRSGSRIHATWPEGLTLEDMATYLLGPVLGFTLRLHGGVCLHASAVVVKGRAIALLAPPGYGKSTFAAFFAKRGYPVLTDDILALVDRGGTFLVQSTYPQIRLWPTSVKAIFGADDALPRISPTHSTWDKCYLDLTGAPYKFQKGKVPLSAIYFGSRNKKNTPAFIDDLSVHETMQHLIGNTYSYYVLEKKMRALELDVLSRVATKTPLRCIQAPGRKGLDWEQIGSLILEDFCNLYPT